MAEDSETTPLSNEEAHTEANLLKHDVAHVEANVKEEAEKQPGLKESVKDFKDTAYLELASQHLEHYKKEDPTLYKALIQLQGATDRLANSRIDVRLKLDRIRNPNSEVRTTPNPKEWEQARKKTLESANSTIHNLTLDVQELNKRGPQSDLTNVFQAIEGQMKHIGDRNYDPEKIGAMVQGVLAELEVSRHPFTLKSNYKVDLGKATSKQEAFDSSGKVAPQTQQQNT